MRLGLTIADFTWHGVNAAIGATLRRIGRSAEESGFARIAVMDQCFGSDRSGPVVPVTSERFERLEEALRICYQMFDGVDAPFDGKHYHLARTLTSPKPVRRPPILVGGSGERKTLRLVARYADSCNLFAGPDLERKLDVLRQHCEEIGRDYTSIEKTVLFPLDPRPGGRHVGRLLAALERFARLGIDTVCGPVPDLDSPAALELMGRHVIPVAAQLGPITSPLW